ncbi:hypothetical protein BOX15_Mlig012909g1 [Macrostomum lignano]|uniref:Uncharacterized protein n=1 Tax=Macrostomum lignano TaxID=282301 RepID=A0A267DY64_9PLAT|nr:hypothetical protein BOX15_Mlig012909g2 [Macrostomum lignano]PAA55204.1 hypothetical protein BOX15_Mlig012909g1 [Macrostomum lignano]
MTQNWQELTIGGTAWHKYNCTKLCQLAYVTQLKIKFFIVHYYATTVPVVQAIFECL